MHESVTVELYTGHYSLREHTARGCSFRHPPRGLPGGMQAPPAVLPPCRTSHQLLQQLPAGTSALPVPRSLEAPAALYILR